MMNWLVLSNLLVFVACVPVRDPEEILNLFEGDIELAPDTGFRSVINEKHKLWPNGEIPYEIDDPQGRITAAQLANLTAAIHNFHHHTCLRFYPKRDPTTTAFLKFQKGNGCSSNVGMVNTFEITGMRGQIIRLSDECFQIGKITHEMMHSIGFFHEQSRYDRDQFVKVIPQNIEQGKMAQFRLHDLSKQNTELGAPYDYGSLMHYPRWAFSQDEGLDTIVPIYEAEIGQRRAMSELDIWKINKLYNCPNLGPVPEVNYGKRVQDDNGLKFPVEKNFRCTFEYYWTCGMRDEMESDVDWQIGEGQTSKYFETGPKAASDDEPCCYIYISSVARQPGDRGVIVSPALQPTDVEGSCLTFYYHMYGSTVGSLEVFWRRLGTNDENIIMIENGNKGDRWMKKNFVLHSNENFEIVFRATLGGNQYNSYEGNIALDNIELRPMFRLKYRGESCE